LKPQQLLAIVAALVAAAVVFIAVAHTVPAFKFQPKLGLDIRGGARVVLEAELDKLPKNQRWDADAKSAVLRTIENRVNANGVAEAVVIPKGDRQFVVEIPSVKNEAEILEQLQNTAQLEFYYSPDWKSNRAPLGRYVLKDDDEIVTRTENGNDVKEKMSVYTVLDTATNKTFRDRAHLNLALREMIERADKAKDKAKDTRLPSPLESLSVAGSRTSLKLLPDDEKALPALAEELTAFDAFLQSARKELTGRDLEPGKAMAGFQQQGSALAVVNLVFTSEGQAKFGKFTTDHTDEILMIYLDGRILMAPNIKTPITNGKAQLEPFETISSAKKLADYLNGGALPLPLKIVQQQSVDATLGADAVSKGVLAGIVGMVAIMIFMVVVYRLPGVVACIALILYTLFSYTVFLLAGVTFTLPGIAGFILSVGMAVDANILIFERTKEELAAGKPLRHAVDEGFKRAFSAIFDSNLCSVVTALLLYVLGSGGVKGFAMTLGIGVMLSMFTAITVSRSLLNLLIEKLGKDAAKQWGSGLWRPNVNAVGQRRVWYGLSLIIIIPLIIFAGPLKGFKTGIEFTGGSELILTFPSPTSRESVEKAVADAGIKEASAQTGDNNVFVRIPPQDGKDFTAEQGDALIAKLKNTFPAVTKGGFERIGSSISSELTSHAIQSIVYSSIFIVLYLAWRFASAGFVTGLKFGFAAIIAMLHDILVLVGVFCGLGYFLNWKIDSLFVTAALTVIGFSVHDTIIIFDRIRENVKLRGNRVEFSQLVAESIRETFARSVFTSGTVLVTLLSLLVLGGAVIRPLNAALFVGILSGTYSSIFNAAPLVVDLSRWFGGKK
jgi:SecD/SecF fusion protein